MLRTEQTNTMCAGMNKHTKKRGRCEMEASAISPPTAAPAASPVKPAKRVAHQSPYEYLQHLANGNKLPTTDDITFHSYSEEEAESYTMDVATAVRNLNIEKMKALQSQGQLFQCSNRFGESLIHIACRRGSLEVAKLLVEEAKVSIKCVDDFGRTPLHDACWTAEPNFELMNFLVSLCPALLFVTDKRGHTPLHYTRREHHHLWNSFLEENKETI